MKENKTREWRLGRYREGSGILGRLFKSTFLIKWHMRGDSKKVRGQSFTIWVTAFEAEWKAKALRQDNV